MLKALLFLAAFAATSAAPDGKTVEEKWPDGSIKLRQQMAEDLRGKMVLNGVETRYLPGGKKQSETTYRLGVKDGPWREYYMSGGVKIEGLYKHGQKDGPETVYNDKGQKVSEVTYKEGQHDGKRTEWQGKRKTYEADYDKDRLVGTARNGIPRVN